MELWVQIATDDGRVIDAADLPNPQLRCRVAVADFINGQIASVATTDGRQLYGQAGGSNAAAVIVLPAGGFSSSSSRNVANGGHAVKSTTLVLVPLETARRPR